MCGDIMYFVLIFVTDTKLTHMERVVIMLQTQTHNTSTAMRHIQNSEHECLTLKVDAIEKKLALV